MRENSALRKLLGLCVLTVIVVGRELPLALVAPISKGSEKRIFLAFASTSVLG